MQIFDMHHGISLVVAKDIGPGTGPENFDIIDTAGFEALEFIFTGSNTVTVIPTFILQHGDESDLSDATTVDSEEVLGSLAHITAADDMPGKTGYIGKKRYVRVRQTAGNALFGIIAILGTAHHQPTPDQ